MEDWAGSLSRAAFFNQAGFGGLIGDSAAMRQLYELAARLGAHSFPVLLLGETGTGKELVARAIHCTGVRGDNKFIPVDCSTLTPTLAESELLGHVKGAFTGADRTKLGLFQAADDGTIFLDEIGELPMFLQAKLLRSLQEKEVRPVGSTERIPINVRVIAATNRDLETGVRAGTFRQDLFFRLNVTQIKLSPLRERKIDIPLLVAHFLKKFSDPSCAVRGISDDALRRLMAHDWPGNVRELENAVESAVALSSGDILTGDDFASVPRGASRQPAPDTHELMPLAELERRAVMQALRETQGDKIAAARLLGIGKTTLYRKLRQYHGVPLREPAGL
jgi:two-component system response regulator HydG